jgi:hypothetical protein
LVLRQILIHKDPHISAMSEGRNAPYCVTGEITRLADGSFANGDFAADRGQQTQINLVAP